MALHRESGNLIRRSVGRHLYHSSPMDKQACVMNSVRPVTIVHTDRRTVMGEFAPVLMRAHRRPGLEAEGVSLEQQEPSSDQVVETTRSSRFESSFQPPSKTLRLACLVPHEVPPSLCARNRSCAWRNDLWTSLGRTQAGRTTLNVPVVHEQKRRGEETKLR